MREIRINPSPQQKPYHSTYIGKALQAKIDLIQNGHVNTIQVVFRTMCPTDRPPPWIDHEKAILSALIQSLKGEITHHALGPYGSWKH
ncbi:hypothetical protein N9291_01260 [bacterium]|nr:hypothetical protein [bacterium]